MSKVKEELENDPLMPLRHTAEHVLHLAMQELYPSLKKAMGPPIEEGFYFDFDSEILLKFLLQYFNNTKNSPPKLLINLL